MKLRKSNLSIVRQNFANAAFSHKVHEMAAERKERKSNIFRVVNVILVAIVMLLFVFQALNPTNNTFSYIGAGLTAAEIIFLIVQLSFGVEREIVSHKNSALKYMALRDRYKELIADITVSALPDAQAVQLRSTYLREYQTISDLALQTNPNDYSNAMSRLNLKPDGQNVWSDKQVNSLLPKELRV
ncbi:SLATT domain-containing protein [Candidatus Saccharibacteria bacterium]|nr:SLATT domain-containing protein [Candidatus Saccharibacteria bacterium]